MWLVNTRSRALEEFEADNVPEYAILSHRWGHEEVSFKDMHNGFALGRAGFTKLKGCCEVARNRGHRHVWIDTCCIDKSSSAELSESINSMFRWYKKAKECLVYLCDVTYSQLLSSDAQYNFINSQWFTRGWTLQELLANLEVIFFNSTWDVIGTRRGLRSLLAQATNINPAVLAGEKPIFDCAVAERMSWAANRVTTRKEDRAYSLLGIFDVYMPMLYGEGERAFRRLQEEIIRQSDDQSVFAWHSSDHAMSILAPSPTEFRDMSSLVRLDPMNDTPSGYTLVNIGLSIQLDLIPWAMGTYLAPLACGYGRNDNTSTGPQSAHNYERACILLRQTDHVNRFVRVTVDGQDLLFLGGNLISTIRGNYAIQVCQAIISRADHHVARETVFYGFQFEFWKDGMFSTGCIPSRSDVFGCHSWNPSKPLLKVKPGIPHIAGAFHLTGFATNYCLFLGFDREFQPLCLIQVGLPLGASSELPELWWLWMEIDNELEKQDTILKLRGDRKHKTWMFCHDIRTIVTFEQRYSRSLRQQVWFVTFEGVQMQDSSFRQKGTAYRQIVNSK